MINGAGRMRQWAAALGMTAVAQFAGTEVEAQGLIRDAEVEHAMTLLIEPVLRGGGVTPTSVDLYLVSDRSLNAFVAGGRNIFMFSGLLMRLGSPEEIQAVLAHELGHINGGHLARRGIEAQQATGALALGILLAIAAGLAGSPDASAAVISGTTTVVGRSFLAFSRSEEASADQAALTYLDRAGIDPSGLLRVLELFRGQEVLSGGRADPYARTHPMSADRILLAERRISQSPHRGTPAPPETVYWFKRMQAKLDGFLRRPEQVLTQTPDDGSEFSLVRRAVALHRTPDPAGALREMQRLLALKPNDAYYQELMGQILMESARLRESVPYYRRALALAPHEPLIRAGLGRALVALDDNAVNSEAITLLERALREDPGNVPALRDLGLAYARAGREGDAAVVTAERFALMRRFQDVAIHAKRAMALLPRGSPGWLKAQDLLLVSERMSRN
ncbi:MAG: M48 family metalloprotease [Pseudomonadota bacterium]